MRKTDCIFCKIIEGGTPAEIIYRDETVVVFNDVRPRAPVHKLIVPIYHIATLNDIQDKEGELLLGHMMLVAKKIANEYGIDEDGYRLILNCNDNGGQEIYHLHIHLLGGRKLFN